MHIKVSAIVSTYKSERFIRGCLEDLTSQTLFKKDALEIVVVISGSPENEEEIVKEYSQRHQTRIVYLVTERESMYCAWNRAIKIARGEYITNANSDDRHRQDALEILSNSLDAKPKISLVYGNCLVTNEENQPYPTVNLDRYPVYIQPQFFAPNAALHYQFGPQAMWRKDVHEKIGYFSDTLKAAGDYDFNLRFAASALRAERVTKEPIGCYLAHQGAISFKDSVITNETDVLYAHYRAPDKVLEFYRNEGLDAKSGEERALLYTDFAIRALEYFPPWFAGNPHRDAILAKKYLELALVENRHFIPALYNLGVTSLLLKDDNTAKMLGDSLSGHGEKDLADIIYKGLKLPQEELQISLLGSGLALPSQREISL